MGGHWRRLAAALAALLLLPWAGARGGEVIDMIGRRVSIGDDPRRVACLEVMCYPRMLMLGAAERVVSRVRNGAPWAERTNPGLAGIAAYDSQPNMEDILRHRPDLALASANYGLGLEALTKAGIPAVVSQPRGNADSPAAFVADAKEMVRLVARVLGGGAPAIAEQWCAYFDERLAFVARRLAGLGPQERPRVYYMRGPSVLSTHGRGGFINWVVTLAGGRMAIDEDGAAVANATISAETLLRWNPDIILVGRQYAPETVLNDPRLAQVAAVRRGQVWSLPEGVYYWDGGPEQVLALQYLAKRMHPDLFADLDPAAEVKAYYARFYRTSLSDDEVANLLDGRSPDGSRFNRFNN